MINLPPVKALPAAPASSERALSTVLLVDKSEIESAADANVPDVVLAAASTASATSTVSSVSPAPATLYPLTTVEQFFLR